MIAALQGRTTATRLERTPSLQGAGNVRGKKKSGLQARRAQGTSAEKKRADSKPEGRRERPRKKKERTPSPQGAGNVRGKKRADSKPAGRRERPRKKKSGLQARRAQGTSAEKKSGLQARRAQGTSAEKKSGPDNSAKAPRSLSNGPVGAVRQGHTGVRHKTAKKVATFWAVGMRHK